MMKNNIVEIKTPWVSPDETVIEVKQWLIASGETVEIDQDILLLLVDGEEFLLPSPVDGIINELLVDPHDILSPDQVLATVTIIK